MRMIGLRAFPEDVSSGNVRAPSALTVAGPRRIFTGFPSTRREGYT
jgi:hypothetical protein